ncbi:MAG: UDP-N-acetylmuramoyl-tripeptide--D-alanyl-D-alanine ligase [Candidatus Omnitrophota bacterium]
MFKVFELLNATQGRLIKGPKQSRVLGISIDSRSIRPQEAFIAIKGKNFNGHDFIKQAIKKGASCVIVSTSYPSTSLGAGEMRVTPRLRSGQASYEKQRVAFIAVRDTIRALGDIARYHRHKIDIPIIAVTGSNGKTTTKEMIAWVLSKRLEVLKNPGTKNNQVGLPLSLLGLNSSHNAAVLELGTNHFGEIAYLSGISEPNIGIITNIGPSHLEFFKDLKGVFREKYSVAGYLKKPRMMILNADDNTLKRKLSKREKRSFNLGFGIRSKTDFSATAIKIRNSRMEFVVNKKYKFTLKVIGYSNIYNALASIAVARVLGMGYNDIASKLSNFTFTQGRLSLLESNNTRFLDDSYNSNPLSLKQALDALDGFKTVGRKIFVMGDMLELGKRKETFHRLAGLQAAKSCDVLITVGSLSKFAAKSAKLRGLDMENIFSCESTLQAKDLLFKKISPGPKDIVLVKGSRSMKMEEIFRT